MSDKLRVWCRNNWDKIDPFIRKDCLDHLEDWFDPKTKLQDIEHLKSAYEGGGWFHFGLGNADPEQAERPIV